MTTQYATGGSPVILPPEALQLIAPDAWMSYRLNRKPLRTNGGGYISPFVRLGSGNEGIKLGLDPGNWKIKTACITPAQAHNRGASASLNGHRGEDHYLVVSSVLTTMRYATRMTSGKQPTVYSILEDDSIPEPLQQQDGSGSAVPSPRFSIQEEPQGKEVIAMPIGPTHIRLSRLHYRRFIQAVIAEALAKAGYPSGQYTIALGLAVRNEEVYIDPSTLEPQVTPVLDPWVNTLYGNFTVQRIEQRDDGAGEEKQATYQITIEEIVTYAQTLGTFYAWYYGLNGKPVPLLLQRQVSRVLLFDLGGGDTQVLDVACGDGREPGTQGRRICPGTREIAQLLAQKCKASPELRLLPELSIAAAQQALISRQVQLSGMMQDVGALVDAAVSEKGGDLVSRIFTEHLEEDALYGVTGAGVNLLHRSLHEYLAALGRSNWRNYLLFPGEVAGELNAIGGQAILSAIYSG